MTDKRMNFRKVKIFLTSKFIFLNGIISIIILALILAFLIMNSLKFFSSYPFLEFITGTKWSPSVFEEFGFVPLFTGSLLITLGAIIIAIPLGIGSAIYIGELAPKAIREILKPIIEVLATIPSIVIILFLIIPFFVEYSIPITIPKKRAIIIRIMLESIF